MRLFGQLLQTFARTKNTSKISLLSDYFNEESPENMPMALHFLMGENLGRFCSGRQLGSGPLSYWVYQTGWLMRVMKRLVIIAKPFRFVSK